ncbi:MAG: hypothetical protein RLZ35_283 [Pseudomonadota bacterium]
MRDLLKLNPNLHAKDSNGRSVLQHAADKENPEIVQALLTALLHSEIQRVDERNKALKMIEGVKSDNEKILKALKKASDDEYTQRRNAFDNFITGLVDGCKNEVHPQRTEEKNELLANAFVERIRQEITGDSTYTALDETDQKNIMEFLNNDENKKMLKSIAKRQLSRHVGSDSTLLNMWDSFCQALRAVFMPKTTRTAARQDFETYEDNIKSSYKKKR